MNNEANVAVLENLEGASESVQADTYSATSERSAEEIFREQRETLTQALNANRANTLPMLEIMRHAEDARPYRELEEEVFDLPVMQMSHQNAHTLSLMLVKAGGLEQTMVEDEGEDVDQPTDYLLQITPAGAAALQDFEPINRFSRLTAQEPSTYRALYKKVLDLCKQNTKTSAIEEALAGEEAMQTPKLIYPGYFISKLETLGALAWENNSWKTTERGAGLAAAL